MASKISPAWLGISIGALVSIVSGLVYFVILHEPGSLFYLFAGLAFFGGPLIGGIVAVLKAQVDRLKVFFGSGSVIFGMVVMLFIFTYAVTPQFARANVQLPDSCDGFDGSFNLPADLTYTLPNGDIGILIVSDNESAIVAQVDDLQRPSFPSTVFIINKNENTILQRMSFENDVISAAIDKRTAYIFNDKLGYLFDLHTGQMEETFLIIDNYGGLSESDRPIISRASSGHWYMETTAVISSWSVDGTVKSRPHLIFNGIARGCFVSGDTREVIQY
jgi:energy-coupling factor transporter transmembrane protein EcfT